MTRGKIKEISRDKIMELYSGLKNLKKAEQMLENNHFRFNVEKEMKIREWKQ